MTKPAMIVRAFAAVALVLALLPRHADAVTVGYWQLQDLAPGNVVTTAASQVNNGALQGVGTGAATRLFNADVPALVTVDGLGGPAINLSNSASLSTSGTGWVDVPFSSLLEPTSFTIEFFMKAPAQGGFPGIVTKSNTVTAGRPTSWGIGKANGEQAFIRIDTASVNNATTSIAGSTADGNWHHFALTHNAATGVFTLWRDYTLSVTINPAGDLTYDGISGLRFGGMVLGGSFQNYTGLVDEVRFSDTALASSQFLRLAGAAEVSVTGLGMNIADGDATPSPSDGTDFGFVLVGDAPVQRMFTIMNDDPSETLYTSDLMVPTGFSVVEGLSPSIAPGGSDTITIALLTTAEGAFSGDVTFNTNDLDEGQYSFAITGRVIVPEPASAALVLLGALGALRRTRRRA